MCSSTCSGRFVCRSIPRLRCSHRSTTSVASSGRSRPTLVTEESGYRLACPPDDVDALRFERLLAGDPDVPTEAALDDVETALALWRGPAFGDLASLDLFRQRADRLEGLRVDAVERRVELLLRAGRDTEAEDAAATLALQQPYREGPVALQIRALARLGRHVEGLRLRRLPSPARRGARRRTVPGAPCRRTRAAHPRRHADGRCPGQLVRRS